MASSVYSRLFMGCTSSLFAGLQVRWYYIVDFIVDFQWSLSGTSAGREISKIEEAGSHFVRQIATKIIREKHDHNNKLLPEHNINKVR